MDRQELQGKIEGILFAMGDSVAIKDIAEALEIEESLVKEIIEEMKVYYVAKERGIQIAILEGNVQLRTKDEYYDDLIKIATVPKKNVLSDSVLETLSIVAYKQPVTRMDIDMKMIKKYYKKLFGNNMADDIKGDTGGNYQKLLLYLIGEK